MSNINVSYDALNNTAGQLDLGREALETQLQALKTLITQLTSDGFVTSQGSGAYAASYEQFDLGATNAVNGLVGLSNFLRQTAQRLEQQDRDIAAAAGA